MDKTVGDSMKKRNLKRYCKDLETRIQMLESRPIPQLCDSCKVLFGSTPQARITWTPPAPAPVSCFPIQTEPVRITGSVGVRYIQTPVLCSRCKAASENLDKKSALKEKIESKAEPVRFTA